MRKIFNQKLILRISNNIKKVYSSFDNNNFINSHKDIDKFGLLERVKLISTNLYQFLPKDYTKALNILINSLEDEQECELKGYDGFYIMPLVDYISTYGIDYFEESMSGLYDMTKRFTAEFGIREFLIKYPDESLKLLKEWVKDENCHIRRLVSEGTRPKLPWAKDLTQFKIDPTPVIELLNLLKYEKTKLVQKSIANSFNDITKNNPKIVIDTLKEWKTNNTKDKNIDWIIKHSLRSLIKDGNREALELIGYSNNIDINISSIEIDKKEIVLGERLNFKFTITSNKEQNLMIDYILYFLKQNNRHSPKVFKLTKKNLKINETITIKKSHLLKFATTRKYYSGIQKIQLQINGIKQNEILEFNLI